MQEINIGVISLGCPKNRVDTEVMLGLTKERGWHITSDPQHAEVIIVNTCGFIESAKQEAIDTILEMSEYKKSGQCRGLIVTGCLAQRYPEQLLAEMPEIDAIVGTGEFQRIVDIIENVLQQGEKRSHTGRPEYLYDEAAPRVLTSPDYTAYIKIAEGCDNRCSYCIIPSLRGAYRSRTIESIVQEAERLVKNGAKEIILIAQDTTNYGTDLYGKPSLDTLLKRLVNIEDLLWIRLMYCYPTLFTDELITLIAEQPKICKYIDLPLQHADDAILRKMNRRGTMAETYQLLEKIRLRLPDVAIRTSFIVGFPGETEEQFEALVQLVEDFCFDHVGVFTYSAEEGTTAANMQEQIPDEIKQERYHKLMAIQARISEQQNQKRIDTTLNILVEDYIEQERVLVGRSQYQAPEIDGHVYVENSEFVEPGTTLQVVLQDAFTYDLVGSKIE